MDLALSLKCDTCQLDCLNRFFKKPLLPELLEHSREITFKKGETIFKQADFISKIVILKTGLLKLYTEGDANKSIIYKFVGDNTFIGLSFLYNSNYASYTVSALKNSTLCFIEKQTIKNLISKSFGLSEFVFNKIAEDMRILFRKLTHIGTKQLHGRLANTIIEIENLQKKGFEIYPYITKKDMAEYSAMSVESLMRLLNEFKSDKLIIQEGKNIIINDYKLLAKLSKLA